MNTNHSSVLCDELANHRCEVCGSGHWAKVAKWINLYVYDVCKVLDLLPETLVRCACAKSIKPFGLVLQAVNAYTYSSGREFYDYHEYHLDISPRMLAACLMVWRVSYIEGRASE